MADAGGRRGRRASRVAIGLMPPLARFSFRGDRRAAAQASESFGVALPTEPMRANESGERAALWLGPDEWLLRAPLADAIVTRQSLEPAVSDPHSLVEISDRQLAYQIHGPAMRDVLAAGCPLDLDPEAFPVGMCTRTILGKAEIILWRPAAAGFIGECGRSFATSVRAFLADAGRECGFADVP